MVPGTVAPRLANRIYLRMDIRVTRPLHRLYQGAGGPHGVPAQDRQTPAHLRAEHGQL